MPRKTPRRHQQGDESRQRILEATLALAAERGYDGTSIAAVTEATGLPASSVYWHFRNKDELLAETLEYSYRRWRASTPTWEVGDQPDDSVQGIRERLLQASRAIAESPEFWRLGLMLGLENRPKEPLARKRYLAVREETRLAIEGWWTQVLPTEALEQHPDSADRLARFHLSVMDGLFVGVRANPDWDVERLVDLIAAGLEAQALSWIEGAA
jgi:AcrR family transcriptional regulator